MAKLVYALNQFLHGYVDHMKIGLPEPGTPHLDFDGLPTAKAADERISLENGTFRLPLKKGKNEIAIALDDNLPGNTQHYGWGMELKIANTSRRALFPNR